MLLDTYEINDALGRPNLEFPYPVTIQGQGAAEESGYPTLQGPNIIQSRNDYGKPSIHFNNTDPLTGNARKSIARGAKIFNVGIHHWDLTTAAIKIDNMSHTMVRDSMLHGFQNGLRGIHIDGSNSMAFRAYNLFITRFTEVGILETGSTGGGHVLNDCHVSIGTDAAVHITTNDWTIRDGQYSGGDNGVAIFIENTINRGGAFLIDSPRLEAHGNNSTGIKIRSAAGKNRIATGTIRTPLCVASTYTGGVFMDIDDMEDLLIENPTGSNWGNAGTKLVRFGANSANNTFVSLGSDPTGLVEDNGTNNRIITS